MIIHYLKISLRNLLKYKTHSLISALCLAVGLVCFTIVSYLMDSIDSSFHDLPNFERRVDLKMPVENNPNKYQVKLFRQHEVKTLEERKVSGLELISCHSYKREAEMLFIDQEQLERPFQLNVRNVNRTFFAYNGATLLYGDRLPQTPDEVVISETCAHKVYGEKNPVGTLVTYVTKDDKKEQLTFKIVNVVTDLSMGTGIDAELFFPCEENSYCELEVQGMLSAHADIRSLNQSLEQLKVNRDSDTMHYTATFLSDQFNDPGRWVLMASIILLSSLILLSSIINFLKFIIQMFYNRQRELALRKCVGSDARGLYALLFAEVLWMCSFSFLLSLALTEVIVPWILYYIPREDLISIHMSDLIGKQLIVFVELLVVCMLVILLPIYRLQKISIIHPINSKSRTHRFRNCMIGVQLVVCTFFLGAASVLVILFSEMNNCNYNPLSAQEAERIIRLNINSISLDKQKRTILDEIKKMPKIERMTYTSFSRLRSSNSFTYTEYLCADSSTVQLLVGGGSSDYFDFFHIPFQGKGLEAEAKGVVYVSEAFAQLLAQNKTDGMVKLGEETYHIGGVYKALYKENEKDNELKGSVFFLSPDDYAYYFRISPGADVAEVMKEIERICYRYVPQTMALSLFTLDKYQSLKNSTVEMMRNIMLILAMVSILLVVLSIYSSISMDIVSRQKEVAIRKINGATPRVIALIFGRTYVILYLLAFVIAFPLLCLLAPKIDEYSYITPLTYWVLGIGLFISIAILVILTTAYKINRIMHINPAEVIKNE